MIYSRNLRSSLWLTNHCKANHSHASVQNTCQMRNCDNKFLPWKRRVNSYPSLDDSNFSASYRGHLSLNTHTRSNFSLNITMPKWSIIILNFKYVFEFENGKFCFQSLLICILFWSVRIFALVQYGVLILSMRCVLPKKFELIEFNHSILVVVFYFQFVAGFY